MLILIKDYNSDMSGKFFVTLLLILPVFSLTPEQIIKRVEDNLRGKSSKGEMIMKVVKKDWSRELHMKFWEKGKDLTLILITYPPKERGIATLKRGKNVWNYIPSIERVIKIPSSMMGASWMGSHFTNDDLVREYSLSRDYNAELLGEDSSNFYLALRPKPESAVVWGKIEIVVSKTKLVPLKEVYFSEKGEKIRQLEFREIRKVEKRWFPFHWVLLPLKKPGEKTELIVKKIQFDVNIPQRLFSLRYLKEMK